MQPVFIREDLFFPPAVKWSGAVKWWWTVSSTRPCGVFIITCQSEAISEALLYFRFPNSTFMCRRCRSPPAAAVQIIYLRWRSRWRKVLLGRFPLTSVCNLQQSKISEQLAPVSQLRCRHFPTCASLKFSANTPGAPVTSWWEDHTEFVAPQHRHFVYCQQHQEQEEQLIRFSRNSAHQTLLRTMFINFLCHFSSFWARC